MKVGYFLRDNGACGYYRVSLPIGTMARKSDVPIAEILQGDNYNKLCEVLEHADVLVVPRLCEDKLIDMCKILQQDGKRIVVDHDDNMFRVSPLSIHYDTCGTDEVHITLKDGTIKDLWIDGKGGFDLKANRKRVERFRRAVEMADLVTTTTDILADVYRDINDNVAVLPNCLDMTQWQKLPLKPHKGVRMGWYGGSSHYEDWTLLEEVLPEVMRKYPQLTLVLMGVKFEGTLKNCPQDRIEFHKWVPTVAYPYKAAALDLDFAVIPLRDTEFNRCKSPIKWIEQGALQVPSVTSFVSPYKEVMKEDNGIFVDNDKYAWIEGISRMTEDEALRLDMGQMAYNTVLEDYNIDTKYNLWEAAYSEVLN